MLQFSFIVISENFRRHLCFCWNWKKLKVLADLTHLAVSILDQDLFQVSIWDNDAALLDVASVSLVAADYLFQKSVSLNNSLNISARCYVTKQKTAYSYSCMSLFISAFWLPQGHFGATAEGTIRLNRYYLLHFQFTYDPKVSISPWHVGHYAPNKSTP